jgi:hypothetical protein
MISVVCWLVCQIVPSNQLQHVSPAETGLICFQRDAISYDVIENDPNDTELRILSTDTEVDRGQCAVSAMMFSPTEHAKQPASIAET